MSSDEQEGGAVASLATSREVFSDTELLPGLSAVCDIVNELLRLVQDAEPRSQALDSVCAELRNLNNVMRESHDYSRSRIECAPCASARASLLLSLARSEELRKRVNQLLWDITRLRPSLTGGRIFLMQPWWLADQKEEVLESVRHGIRAATQRFQENEQRSIQMVVDHALDSSAPAHEEPFKSRLEILDEDTLSLIVYETRGIPGALLSMSSVSRRLREHVIPVLFARCTTDYYGNRGVPPPTIRPLVRHLTYKGRCTSRFYSDTFGVELPYLPALSSITFDGDDYGSGVPWQALERCLRIPQLRAVAWGSGVGFSDVDPYPEQAIADMPIHLASLHCERPYRMWRMLVIDPYEYAMKGVPMEQDLTHESLSLTPLVLRTHKTIESLRLMMESASLTRMGELTWPNLHEITFSGEFLTSSTTTGLPFAHLLQRTPRLRILSVKVALRYGSDRLSILGRTPQPWIKALKLRSLALSYPDPVDVIFCANMAALTHLSLCDSPRYHYHLAFTIVSNRYSAPILTSAECLSILKRMNMPALESLALSYIADEADDDLLRYVTEAFPRLHTLELHRYRKNRRDIVQHAHIAHLLSRAEMLRHVFLNLDFHDDHGPPGKGDWHEVVHSFDPIHNARGFELVTIMERCPGLKYVALLRHYELASKWVEYYPSRWAKSRYVIVPKWDSLNPYFES